MNDDDAEARSGGEGDVRRSAGGEGASVTGGHTSYASEEGPVPRTMTTEAGARRLEGLIEYVPGYRRLRQGAPPGRRSEETPDRFLLPERFAREAAMVSREPALTPENWREAGSLRPVAPTTVAIPSVIDNDDRVLISPTNVDPYRAICALRVSGTIGDGLTGTGWLIDSRTVITAGHCVYDKRIGGWASSVEVIPALDSAARPFGSVVGSRVRSVSGWIQDGSREYDYGAILLDEPVRLEGGFFVPEALSAAEIQGTNVNLAGYPSDRENGTRLFFHAREVREIAARTIQYDIDTFRGQSGAPVWVTLRDGRRLVVAIHTNGIERPVIFNSGLRITSEVIENLRRWSEEAATSPRSARRRALPVRSPATPVAPALTREAARESAAPESAARESAAPESAARESAAPEAGAMAREITGKVVDEAGRPLAGVTVTFAGGDDPRIATISEADGSFSLPITRPGRHTLRAFSSRGTGTATVTSEQPGPVTLVIESRPEAPARGARRRPRRR